jgi:hypothetical protein
LLLAGPTSADGFHTPFRSVEELRQWWTTRRASFPGAATPRPGQVASASEARPCSVAGVPAQVREALAEILQTLRFFHAENVIKREYPDITGKAIGSVQDEIVRVLTDFGEPGLPYLLQEMRFEINDSRDGAWSRDKAELLARRTVQQYFEASLDRIRKLEAELAATSDQDETRRLIASIEHAKGGIDLVSLRSLESSLREQYAGLRPRKDYVRSLETVVRGLEVRAVPCLLVALWESGDEARKRFEGLLVESVRKGLAVEREPGWRTALLRRSLPDLVALLESEVDDVRDTGAECLLLLTGKRFGTDAERWFEFLSDTYAPEMAEAMARKRAATRRLRQDRPPRQEGR